MTSVLLEKQLADYAQTEAFGAWLAPFLRAGDIVALSGGLGAGKTTLSRGLINAVCNVTEVPSPTYTLVQTYEGPAFDIWHFDLYRLENQGDVWELGIEDAIETGVCLIEWPQRIASILSGAELTIEINIDESGRTAVLTGDEQWRARFE